MVNSLGDAPSRKKYKDALLEYLKPHFESLSSDSQTRFTKNPLRILDSKDPEEKALLETAPSILDFLSLESKKHFDELCSLLKSQRIPFSITPQLVRGLDYYNHTVFEITSNVLGAQNTIGAGGRYDGLLPALGGPDLPCIGFSTGIERILQTMEGQSLPFPEKKGPLVTLIPLTTEAKHVAFPLLYQMRHEKISSEMIETKKIQKALQQADQMKAGYVIIIGDDELKKGVVQIKEMKTRNTEDIPLNSLVEHFLKRRNRNGL